MSVETLTLAETKYEYIVRCSVCKEEKKLCRLTSLASFGGLSWSPIRRGWVCQDCDN